MYFPIPNADPILIKNNIQDYINQFWIRNNFNGELKLTEQEFKNYSENLIKELENSNV